MLKAMMILLATAARATFQETIQHRALRNGTRFNETYFSADHCGFSCGLPTVIVDGSITLNNTFPAVGRYQYHSDPALAYAHVQTADAVTINDPSSPRTVKLIYLVANNRNISVTIVYEVVAMFLTQDVKLLTASDTFSLACKIHRQRAFPAAFTWEFAYPTNGVIRTTDWKQVSRQLPAYSTSTKFWSYHQFSVAENATTSALSLVVLGATDGPKETREPSAAYAGHYRCTAVLGEAANVGQAVRVQEVTNVLTIAVAVPLPTDKPLYWDNDTATLSCLVFGNPLPNVMWLKKNADSTSATGGIAEPLDEASVAAGKYIITVVDQTSSLTINNLRPSDRACYQCNVGNRLGADSADVLLRVRSAFMLFYPSVGIVVELLLLAVCFARGRREGYRSDDSSTDLAIGMVGGKQAARHGSGKGSVADAAAGHRTDNAAAVPLGYRKPAGEVTSPNNDRSSLNRTPKNSMGALYRSLSRPGPVAERSVGTGRRQLWEEAKSSAAAAAIAAAKSAATAVVAAAAAGEQSNAAAPVVTDAAAMPPDIESVYYKE